MVADGAPDGMEVIDGVDTGEVERASGAVMDGGAVAVVAGSLLLVHATTATRAATAAARVRDPIAVTSRHSHPTHRHYPPTT